MSTPSNLARDLMAGWVLTAALVSLIGNSTVLLASLRHRALKLDKVSVALIEHIAVADIATALQCLGIFNDIVSEHFFVDEKYCRLYFALFTYIGTVDVLLVCALNISKLTSLLSPFLARVRSSKNGHLIAAIIWLLASPVLFFVKIHGGTSPDSFYFRQATYRCAPNFTDPTIRTVIPILISTYILVPVFVVMLCTIALLRFVNRSRGLALQSVVTILSISGIYLVSYIPYAVDYLLETFGVKNMEFTRFAVYVSCLNLTMNPLIYYFSVKSYGDFIRNSVGRVVNKLQSLFGRLFGRGNKEPAVSLTITAVSRRYTV